MKQPHVSYLGPHGKTWFCGTSTAPWHCVGFSWKLLHSWNLPLWPWCL